MSSKTEGTRTGEFVQSLASGDRSKDEITVKSGQDLTAGTVMARETTDTPSSSADAGNTGDGTLGTLSAGVTAKEGVYTVTFVEPGTNVGTFQVEDPDGINVGTGVVAVAFTGGGLTFTIADGATDFVSGDQFTITVEEATFAWKVLPNDQSEEAAGILWADVDASAAAKSGVAVVRDAEVADASLTWPTTSFSDADKDKALRELEALGIIVR